jgi:hypothetical protein
MPRPIVCQRGHNTTGLRGHTLREGNGKRVVIVRDGSLVGRHTQRARELFSRARPAYSELLHAHLQRASFQPQEHGWDRRLPNRLPQEC